MTPEREALANLLRYVEGNECMHESLHRGGAIWTICDDCGRKWADDRSGYVPYSEPSEITAAREALFAAPGEPCTPQPAAGWDEDWRTMDSAPKDGRYVLAGRFRGDELKWVKHSRWMSAEEACEQEGGASADDYDAGWTDGEDEHDYCHPTHWMPLKSLRRETPAPAKYWESMGIDQSIYCTVCNGVDADLTAPCPSEPSPPTDRREIVAKSVRTFCNSVSPASVQISSDGIERIYYAGLSVPGLVDAILAALDGGR